MESHDHVTRAVSIFYSMLTVYLEKSGESYKAAHLKAVTLLTE